VLFQESALSPADPEEVKNNLEVLNYLSASFSGERWLADGRPFGLHLIHSLHVALLKGTRGENRHPGQFRPDQVVIGAPGDTPEDARFVPPPPEHVQPAIEDVLDYIGESYPHPPLIAAAVTHYQFETIHPFQDGNGRLGRLLIPLQLIQSNAITQPLIYLSPYFEARRDEYLARLKNVSTKGDWESWVLFFLDAVTVQAEDARSRVQRILALHDRYRQLAATKRSKGPTYAVDAVMEKVIVTARQVAQYANCDFTTAQSALAALEELGIVVKVEPSYPQRWIAQELMREVYEQ
jgi:Fic family protein